MTTWKFGSNPINFYIQQYVGGGTAVDALCRDELFLGISTSMPNALILPDGQFYLKDWTENEDIAQAMIEEGIIEAVVPSVLASSGFITTRAYQFTDLGKQYCIASEPCTREHLEAVMPRLTFWTVDAEGEPVGCIADSEDDLQPVESYICNNCHESWEVKDWHAALDHLTVKQPAARAWRGRC